MATNADSSTSILRNDPNLSRSIAPGWHTLVLVAAIVGFSIHGALQFSAVHSPIHRLATYGLTAAMELGMLAWIILGLRLRKTPLRSLLGCFEFSFRSIVVDVGIALVFWVASLILLGTLAVAWTGAAAIFAHQPKPATSAQTLAPSASQKQQLKTMMELAPANGAEIVAWVGLCMLAGFSEEVAFRGYLQRQFIAGARGGIAIGILLSAMCFGAAHGYEGARGMFLITAFGVLFSVLAHFRRSLRAGMIAHAWQDILAGIALAFLRSHKFL